MTTYTGQCHCTTVKFICTGEPLFTQYCHCSKCREIASTSAKDQDKIGYSYTAAYLTPNFSIAEGENHLEKIIRNTSTLLICSSCKSLIYGVSLDPAKQGGIGINANNFLFNISTPESFKPVRHVWYSKRMVEFRDALPKFKDSPVEQFGSGELLEE